MKEHNPNCSIKNIPIEFASCTCGITNTMTFNEIEKEYRKEIQRQAKLASIKYGTSIQLQEDFHILLLKQSFVKYLQSEVERLEEEINILSCPPVLQFRDKEEQSAWRGGKHNTLQDPQKDVNKLKI